MYILYIHFCMKSCMVKKEKKNIATLFIFNNTYIYINEIFVHSYSLPNSQYQKRFDMVQEVIYRSSNPFRSEDCYLRMRDVYPETTDDYFMNLLLVQTGNVAQTVNITVDRTLKRHPLRLLFRLPQHADCQVNVKERKKKR